MELRHNAPARLRLRKGEVDRVFIGRHLDALDLFQFLDAALDLLRLGRRRAEAVDERLQSLNPVPLIPVRGFDLNAPVRLLHQILLVVAAVEVDPLVPQLYDLGDGDIQEITVVRD